MKSSESINSASNGGNGFSSALQELLYASEGGEAAVQSAKKNDASKSVVQQPTYQLQYSQQSSSVSQSQSAHSVPSVPSVPTPLEAPAGTLPNFAPPPPPSGSSESTSRPPARTVPDKPQPHLSAQQVANIQALNEQHQQGQDWNAPSAIINAMKNAHDNDKPTPHEQLVSQLETSQNVSHHSHHHFEPEMYTIHSVNVDTAVEDMLKPSPGSTSIGKMYKVFDTPEPEQGEGEDVMKPQPADEEESDEEYKPRLSLVKNKLNNNNSISDLTPPQGFPSPTLPQGIPPTLLEDSSKKNNAAYMATVKQQLFPGDAARAQQAGVNPEKLAAQQAASQSPEAFYNQYLMNANNPPPQYYMQQGATPPGANEDQRMITHYKNHGQKIGGPPGRAGQG